MVLATLPNQDAGDEEARQDKEHIHPGEATGRPVEQVVGEYGENSDCAHPLKIPARAMVLRVRVFEMTLILTVAPLLPPKIEW